MSNVLNLLHMNSEKKKKNSPKNPPALTERKISFKVEKKSLQIQPKSACMWVRYNEEFSWVHRGCAKTYEYVP